MVQHAGCADLALQRSAIDCRLKVGRPELVEHLDYFVAAKVGSITQWRSPIAISNAGILV